MSVIANIASKFAQNCLLGKISPLDNAATLIKVALVTTVPQYSTVDNYGELGSTEVDPNTATGVGYTSGGAILANKTVTLSGNTSMFDADDVSWANSTITAKGAVVYDGTPADPAQRKVIAVIDFQTSTVSSQGIFRMVWNSNGIFKVSATTN